MYIPECFIFIERCEKSDRMSEQSFDVCGLKIPVWDAKLHTRISQSEAEDFMKRCASKKAQPKLLLAKLVDLSLLESSCVEDLQQLCPLLLTPRLLLLDNSRSFGGSCYI